jgi:hypothetical protein
MSFTEAEVMAGLKFISEKMSVAFPVSKAWC